MDTKVIYSMVGVGKTYPLGKQVLRDISLSYFYGAKIGVIGLNGAGNSTLLCIMAGVEIAFHGDTILAPGYTIGYLEQEPVLDRPPVPYYLPQVTLGIAASWRPAKGRMR